MSICPSHSVPPEWCVTEENGKYTPLHPPTPKKTVWRGSIEKIIIFFCFENKALGAQNNGT